MNIQFPTKGVDRSPTLNYMKYKIDKQIDSVNPAFGSVILHLVYVDHLPFPFYQFSLKICHRRLNFYTTLSAVLFRSNHTSKLNKIPANPLLLHVVLSRVPKSPSFCIFFLLPAIEKLTSAHASQEHLCAYYLNH